MNSDYSMFYNRPSLGSSLTGLAQSIQGIRTQGQQSKLAEIAMQQEQLKAQQAQDEQKKRADYERRLSQYMGLKQINPQMTPQEDQELQNRIFAPEMLQRRIQDPFEAQRLAQRDKELGIRSDNLTLNKDRSSLLQSHRDRMYDFANKKYDTALIDANRRFGLAVEKFNFDKSGGNELMKRTIEDSELLQEITPELQTYKKPNQDLNTKGVLEINNGTAAVGSIMALGSKLKKDIQDMGTLKFKGAKKAEMNSRVLSLMSAINNPMFYEAGVLQAGDREAILDIIGDPTAFSTLTKEEALGRMKAFDDFVEARYVTSLDARGVEGKKGYKAILNKYNNYFETNNLDSSDDDLMKEMGY